MPPSTARISRQAAAARHRQVSGTAGARRDGPADPSTLVRPLPHPVMRSLLTLLVVLLAVWSCERTDDRIQVDRSPASFFVERDSIASVHLIAGDSLSDAAMILQVIPEPDGRTVAVVFADSAIGVKRGLALADPERHRASLVWPDSVTAAWWRDSHRLHFETAGAGGENRGFHAIVNVHADSLEHLETGHDSVPRPPGRPLWLNEARSRAAAYVDSVRDQPAGTPRQGSLRYDVTMILASPKDRLAAFYVTAHGRDDERVNPAWYLMHVPSGRVAPIDSVIGRADDLLPGAAAWTPEARFIYAQGTTLYSARVAAATRSLQ